MSRIAPQRRRARKRYPCDNVGEDHSIVPGEHYWRLVLAPREDVNSSDQFWQLRLCEHHYRPHTVRG